MKDLLKVAYNAMDEKLAEDLVVIDFRKQSPFVDYFIIGSAKNQRMANSILDNIEDKVSQNGFVYKHTNRQKNNDWILIDLGEIVCHVFCGECRKIYNLEGLWKDLPIVKM